jgi:rhodanese-related sulfurtransferase
MGPSRMSANQNLQQTQPQVGGSPDRTSVSPVDPVTSHQQNADAYALQQGMQFAAQLGAPVGSPLEQTAEPRQQQSQQQATRFQEVPNTVPLAAGVERLDPTVVQDLLRNNRCVLVDVRGDDRASGTIQGSVHIKAVDTVPFESKIPGMVQSFSSQPLVIFHCQYSAHRAPSCANWYREHAAPNQRVAIMDGGFRGWESTGLPVHQGSAPQQNMMPLGIQPPAQQQNIMAPGFQPPSAFSHQGTYLAQPSVMQSPYAFSTLPIRSC